MIGAQIKSRALSLMCFQSRAESENSPASITNVHAARKKTSQVVVGLGVETALDVGREVGWSCRGRALLAGEAHLGTESLR